MAGERQLFDFRFTDATKLRITTRGEKEYSDLDVKTDGLLGLTITQLSWYVENTDERDCDPDLLRLLGRYLFELLFSSDPASLRGDFINSCRSQVTDVTFSFDQKAMHLAQLPWELLWVPEHVDSLAGAPLAALDNVNLTMARRAANSIERTDDELRVLYARYGPSTQAELLSLTPVFAELKSLATDAGAATRFNFRPVETDDLTFDALKWQIDDYEPHIVHLSGHGEQNAFWFAGVPADLATLDRPLGWGSQKGPEAYTEHFSKLRDLFDHHVPQLAVLDACWTDKWQAELLPVAAHALVQKVPAVIAMRYRITNEASVRFSRALYRAVLEGTPIGEAVQQARRAVVTAKPTLPGALRAAGTPVLYVKHSVELCASVLVPETVKTEKPLTKRQAELPCPRCGTHGMWVEGAEFCAKCEVQFRCANPGCSRRSGYSAEMITVAPGKCPFCRATLPAPLPLEPDAAVQPHVAADRFDAAPAVEAVPETVADRSAQPNVIRLPR